MSDIHALESNLDLKQNLNVYANCKQLDVLHLIFNIFDGGSQADLTNYNVRLKAMKADNVLLIQDTQYTINKNVVTIIPNEQLTTTSGTTKIELQFINTKTGEKKATFNLALKVNPSVLENERSISTATYTLIEELENKLDKAASFFENINKAIDANTTLVTTTDNANTTNANLNTTIYTGNTLKTTLESLNTNANETKSNLDASNKGALATKLDLDTSNTNAISTQNALDSSNAEANTTKKNLDSSNLAANTTKTNLDTSNENATTTKSDLDKINADANVTKSELASINDAATITKKDLTDINTTADATKTDLAAENVRAETNITAMQSFGDVTQLSQNVTSIKAEIENARDGEVDLNSRLDRVAMQLSDLDNKKSNNTDSVRTTTAKDVTGAINELNSSKANDSDSSRTTIDKTVTGAINELNSNKANKDGILQANLNADMLDGKNSSDFAPSGYGLGTNAKNITNIDLNTIQTTGFYQGMALTNAPTTGFYYVTVITYGAGWTVQYITGFGAGSTNNAPDDSYVRTMKSSVWGPWRRIAYSESITLTMLNGWHAYGSPYDGARAVRIGNTVTLHGLVAGGTTSTALAQLPVGWRPPGQVIGMTLSGANNAVGRIDIASDGSIVPNGTSTAWIPLNGITFYVNN